MTPAAIPPTTDNRTAERPVLLFDGVCNLCSAWVRFVLARERRPALLFASLQSDIGRTLLEQHGLDADALDSLVLVDGDAAWTKSTAALRILATLRFPWNLVSLLRILPRFIRDAVYSWIARRRYAMFGRTAACQVPQPAQLERFLDQPEVR